MQGGVMLPRTGTRAFVAGGFAACAMLVTAASVAWACEAGIFSGTPAITANPSSVTVGTTEVQVSGRSWTNRELVVFRWGSENGAQIGSALPGGTNGEFTTSVTIPQVAAGDSYSILAIQNGGKRYGLPFRVTAPASSGNTDQPPTESQNTTNSVSVADPEPAPSNEPSPSSASAPSGTARTPVAAAPPPVTSTSGRAPATLGSEPGRAGGPVPAVVEPTVASPTGRTPAAVQGAGLLPDPAPAPLAGAVEQRASGTTDGTGIASGAVDPVPSPRTASGDLWSGFSQATGPSGPSLNSLPAASGGSSDLAIGLGLLSAGLVALFAGFGVAEVNRRRVPVTRKAG